MKAIKITEEFNKKNGRPLKYITILGEKFLYCDKRGFSTNSHIDIEFANEIIRTFEVEVGRTGLPIHYPEILSERDVKLSWTQLTGGYKLLIHSHGQHVWSSKLIQSN